MSADVKAIRQASFLIVVPVLTGLAGGVTGICAGGAAGAGGVVTTGAAGVWDAGAAGVLTTGVAGVAGKADLLSVVEPAPAGALAGVLGINWFIKLQEQNMREINKTSEQTMTRTS